MLQRMETSKASGSSCCKENHVIISMIQTEDSTFLINLIIRPSPTLQFQQDATTSEYLVVICDNGRVLSIGHAMRERRWICSRFLGAIPIRVILLPSERERAGQLPGLPVMCLNDPVSIHQMTSVVSLSNQNATTLTSWRTGDR